MMLDANVGDLLNSQINNELYSAYLYLTFADYYEARGLKGYANWYMIQVEEELAHAKILRRYLLDSNYPVTMLTIKAPDKAFTNDRGPLEAGYEHEKYITDCINDCYRAAHEAQDFRTMQLLDWFIKEQHEEEVNASDMLKDYELFCKDSRGLHALDREYRARTFNEPDMLL